jgi:hypothetical protein
MEAVRHVLVVSSRISHDAEVFRRFFPALQQVDCELHRVPDGSDVLELVRSTSFDLLVLVLPLEQPPAEALIRAIRQEGSACRRSAVLVLMRPEHRLEAESLLEQGANRLLGLDDPGQEMAAVVSELLGVAPRVALRANLRIEFEPHEGDGRVRAEIDNLSISGMLVRGGGSLDRGTTLSFELWLPGEDEAIHGVAEVVRQAADAGGSGGGFAARFLAFRSVGRQRLEAFLVAEMERG